MKDAFGPKKGEVIVMRFRRRRNFNNNITGKLLIASGVLIIVFTTPVKTLAIITAIGLIIFGLILLFFNR